MKQGNIMEALELWILNNFLFIVFVGSGIVMLTALFKDFTGQTPRPRDMAIYCLMAAALVVSLSFVNSLPIGFLVLFTIVAIGFTLIYALNRRAEAKEKYKV
jgi:hypothetical protein